MMSNWDEIGLNINDKDDSQIDYIINRLKEINDKQEQITFLTEQKDLYADAYMFYKYENNIGDSPNHYDDNLYLYEYIMRYCYISILELNDSSSSRSIKDVRDVIKNGIDNVINESQKITDINVKMNYFFKIATVCISYLCHLLDNVKPCEHKSKCKSGITCGDILKLSHNFDY